MDNQKDLSQEPLSPEEARAFNALKETRMQLPDSMANDTVNLLRKKGLIESHSSTGIGWWRYLGSGVAAVFVFILGYWIGQGNVGSTASPVTGDTYLLLLHEEEGSIPYNDPGIDMEYGNWARTLAADNVFIGGSELDPGVRVVGSWDPKEDSDISTGYFMIRAGSMEEAAQIARECPHLGYGGSVEVRKINQH